MTTDERIEVADEAVWTFIPGVQFYWQRELRMCWPKWDKKSMHDFPARLRSSGDWPMFGYHQRPTGGTGMQAIAQLIRYIRDLPRLPLETWEYWASDTIKLTTPQTVEILRLGGYFDPKKTCCVLCGKTDWSKGGLDWWSLDKVIGPSCWGGRCRDVPHLVKPAA
jgi:hypothetical protein